MFDDILLDLLQRYEDLRDQGQTPLPKEICKEHPELLAEFKKHVKIIDEQRDFFATDADATWRKVLDQAIETPLPAIPGYEILEQLGKGGMGVVYRARHLKLKNFVALKMILRGRGSPERFQAEAEAVARLQHPNIVHIYEIGAHDGLPYFSLELVDGVPNTLSMKLARTPQPAAWSAAVVETLARAMHFAHERQIIHRDLKPSNILLTADGAPKISDFGLAKKLDEPDLTATGQGGFGTPSYMAPEQLGGSAEKTGPVTDVYALGAILYECLTGRPPFVAETIPEIVRQVAQEEPVPPKRLNASVPRDLETICLKCLSKNPVQRYSSANALADDLNRFLQGKPIVARPASFVEHSWRWAKRRPAVAALWVASLLALVSLIVAAGYARQAEHERIAKLKKDVEAAHEAERANLISIVLLEGIFDDPLGVNEKPFHFPREAGQKMPMSEFLKHAKRAAAKIQHDPTKAKILRSIGNAYHTLGMFDEAKPLLEESLALLRSIPGRDDHLDVAESLNSLAALAHVHGKYDHAFELYKQTLDMRRRLLKQEGKHEHDPLITNVLYSLAWVHADMEQFETAKQGFEEVLRLRELRRDNPPESESASDLQREVALARLALAGLGIKDGLGQENALPLVGAIRALVDLERDKELSDVLDLLVDAFQARPGFPERAVDLFAKARGLSAKRFPRNHLYVSGITFFLAQTLQQTGKLKEAEKEYEECLAIIKEATGFGHASVPEVAEHYARLLEKLGKRERAEKLLREVVKAHEERFSPGHFRVANAMMIHAKLLLEWNDIAGAEQVARRALEIFMNTGAERRRHYQACCNILAQVQRLQKDAKVN